MTKVLMLTQSLKFETELVYYDDEVSTRVAYFHLLPNAENHGAAV